MRLAIEDTDEAIVSNGGLAVAEEPMKSLKIGAELKKVKVSSEEPEISNWLLLKISFEILRSKMMFPKIFFLSKGGKT